MSNFFMLGPERVRWEIAAVAPSGPYRLSINLGPAGTVVEYFDDPTAALLREADIEAVLTQPHPVASSSLGLRIGRASSVTAAANHN
ncbi:MAG: hypothetical protein A3G76_05605 [Acidobacteria bacterium RIFCSPLOWO2_12_FULL_65_11]|nr:MAG: hypothetical protein A3H95_03115 [Acidobacteria bacterium RIFCSPLOWO2_02_FULL_64_15]OFW29362.1 MAG: hypothetical protein A3G76_05605 [Acidobacteria bacterium RIFCSPLOWO2_12_FULL_65_11]